MSEEKIETKSDEFEQQYEEICEQLAEQRENDGVDFSTSVANKLEKLQRDVEFNILVTLDSHNITALRSDIRKALSPDYSSEEDEDDLAVYSEELIKLNQIRDELIETYSQNCM